MRSVYIFFSICVAVVIGWLFLHQDFPELDKTSDTPIYEVDVTVDFGRDLGQNFGSLFEIQDSDGKVVMGAGFQGNYNTNIRANRHTLHFFVKTGSGLRTHILKRLPRVNNDCGIFLMELDHRLFARSVSQQSESFFRFWDPTKEIWRRSVQVATKQETVASGVIWRQSNGRSIYFNHKPIFKVDDEDKDTLIMLPYYANGTLFLCEYSESENYQQPNRLLAYPYVPGEKEVDLSRGSYLSLDDNQSFPYSYGQLKGAVLIATNKGALYRFTEAGFETLVAADTSTSSQFYSMQNFYDKLLIGHYPSGTLYEYDGQSIQQRENWLPRLANVSPHGREVQTMAIYRGDLYVGVWPWGELWRYNVNEAQWGFEMRLFSHPKPTAIPQHPYEFEATKVGDVYNRWGQRIYSMLPFQDSLFISTSSKDGMQYDEQFNFMTEDQWKDYGVVYQLTIEGQISSQMEWKDRPTLFSFEVLSNQIRILQDDKLLGYAFVGSNVISGLSPKRVRWGYGVFGLLNGKLIKNAFHVRTDL